MNESGSEHTPSVTSARCASAWLTVALIVSAVGTIGRVYLSVGLGLKACPLCFYQRSFVMAALAVQVLGWYVERSRPGLVCLLSVPMAWAGMGVAVFHEHLVLTGVLECPKALFGLGTAPEQSLVVFVALVLAVSAGAWTGRGESQRQGAATLIGAILFGAALAGACVKSAPPLPPIPTAPYDAIKQPLDTCRRSFVAASK